MSAVSTDGCTELTCPHHGQANLEKLADFHSTCWLLHENCNDWYLAGEKPEQGRSHSHYMAPWMLR